MDDFLFALAILGLLLLAAAAARQSVVAWRRAVRDTGTLPLWQAMHRRGLEPADAAGQERSLAVAVRRCILCPGREACEHWLAGERDDLGAFCSNMVFLENLGRAKSRAIAKR